MKTLWEWLVIKEVNVKTLYRNAKLSKSAIYAVLNGKAKPRISTRHKIAKTLDLNINLINFDVTK
jgi:DNA-binding phage protein